MSKLVLLMDGLAEGKTQFNEVVKQPDLYWTWNINPFNVLSVVTHDLGWDGERNSHYYNWTKEFMDLSNKWWDFKRQYIKMMISKLYNHDVASLLIVHNCNPELVEELKSDCENVYNVIITDNDEIDPMYDFTLNCKSEEYPNKILDLLEKLGVDKIKNNKQEENEKGE